MLGYVSSGYLCASSIGEKDRPGKTPKFSTSRLKASYALLFVLNINETVCSCNA
jgi:hypothetical protein